MRNKISPSQINKLVMKGRLIPILKTDAEGNTYMYGYRRKNDSRKSNNELLFSEPQIIKELSKNNPTVAEPLPTPFLNSEPEIPEIPTVQLFD